MADRVDNLGDFDSLPSCPPTSAQDESAFSEKKAGDNSFGLLATMALLATVVKIALARRRR